MAIATLLMPPRSKIGWGALADLPEEIARFAVRNILIIADPITESLGVLRRIVEPLQEAGYTVTTTTEVEPEPSLALAEKLVAYGRDGQFDAVIGVGGGSAIDLAKLVGVLATHEGPVADYLVANASRTIEHKGMVKIYIPTTAGTGSEVTNVSVLSVGKAKDVILHPNMVADLALVDASLTASMPARITAATGLDALTHAVEAYVSLNHTPVSDAFALQAMGLIREALPLAYHDGTNQQAREAMAYASYLAGLAFFNAGVAAVHALGYPLGGMYHIAHGETNAVLLPYVSAYIRPYAKKRLADIYRVLQPGASLLSDEDASLAAVEEIHRIVAQMGVPTTLDGFQVPYEDLPLLVSEGAKQTRILARSPRPLFAEDIERIYASAFSGRFVE